MAWNTASTMMTRAHSQEQIRNGMSKEDVLIVTCFGATSIADACRCHAVVKRTMMFLI